MHRLSLAPALPRLLLLLALGALPLAARAFAPLEGAGAGGVRLPAPARPQARGVAADAVLSPALARWRAAGWHIRLDARTGTAHRIVGPGLPLATPRALPTSAAEASQIALDFFRAHADLLGDGVRPDDLSGEVAVWNRQTETWYVGLGRRLMGLPVEGAQAEIRLQRGRVVLVAVDTFPDVQADPSLDTSVFTVDQGWRHARALGGEVLSPPRLVWVPLATGNGPVQGRLGWRVERRQGATITTVASAGEEGAAAAAWGVWYLDPQTGAPFAHADRLRTFEATLSFQVDDRHPGGGLVAAPARWWLLEGQRTSAEGRLDVAKALDTTALLAGTWAALYDAATGDWVSLAVAATEKAPSALLVAGDEAAQANLDAYIAAHAVRDRAAHIDIQHPWVSYQVPVVTNYSDACNAYFDGKNLVFFAAGGGCNNTGRIADVMYHEFGHGFHYYAIATGSYDASMGEGAADYLAATLTDDPAIGPYFYTNGDPVREIDTDRVYPDHYNSSTYHDSGRIYAGALWDLRAALIARDGRGAGIERADALFYATLPGADDMTDAYTEAILAADDDGDTSNGVVDGCALRAAFSAHGLDDGPTVYDALTMAHTSPGRVAAGADLPLTVTVARGDCGGPPVTAVTAEVLDDKDAVIAVVSLTPDKSAAAETWTGQIPAPKAPGPVRYRLRATDGLDTALLPEASQGSSAFEAYSGDLLTVACQTFEAGWEGWQTGAATLDSSTLAHDEWELGTPAGQAGDPRDSRGGMVAGIDLGLAGDADGRYEASTYTWLESPPLTAADHRGLRLQLWRHLAVEEGRFDQARLLVNGEEVWAPAPGQDHTDPGWMFMDIPLGEALDTVTVRLELLSDAGKEPGGWTLDDLCLLAERSHTPEDTATPDDTALTEDTAPPRDTALTEDTAEDTDPPKTDPGSGGGKSSGCHSLPTAPPGGMLALLLGLCVSWRAARRMPGHTSSHRGAP